LNNDEPLLAPLPPSGADDTEPETEMNSGGMFAGGLVSTILGAGLLGTGIGFYAASQDAAGECYEKTASSTGGVAPTCGLAGMSEFYVALPMMITGGLGVAAGIPLTIAGAFPVPVENAKVTIGTGTLTLSGSF